MIDRLARLLSDMDAVLWGKPGEDADYQLEAQWLRDHGLKSAAEAPAEQDL